MAKQNHSHTGLTVFCLFMMIVLLAGCTLGGLELWAPEGKKIKPSEWIQRDEKTELAPVTLDLGGGNAAVQSINFVDGKEDTFKTFPLTKTLTANCQLDEGGKPDTWEWTLENGEPELYLSADDGDTAHLTAIYKWTGVATLTVRAYKNYVLRGSGTFNVKYLPNLPDLPKTTPPALRNELAAIDIWYASGIDDYQLEALTNRLTAPDKNGDYIKVNVSQAFTQISDSKSGTMEAPDRVLDYYAETEEPAYVLFLDKDAQIATELEEHGEMPWTNNENIKAAFIDLGGACNEQVKSAGGYPFAAPEINADADVYFQGWLTNTLRATGTDTVYYMTDPDQGTPYYQALFSHISSADAPVTLQKVTQQLPADSIVLLASIDEQDLLDQYVTQSCYRIFAEYDWYNTVSVPDLTRNYSFRYEFDIYELAEWVKSPDTYSGSILNIVPLWWGLPVVK